MSIVNDSAVTHHWNHRAKKKIISQINLFLEIPFVCYCFSTWNNRSSTHTNCFSYLLDTDANTIRCFLFKSNIPSNIPVLRLWIKILQIYHKFNEMLCNTKTSIKWKIWNNYRILFNMGIQNQHLYFSIHTLYIYMNRVYTMEICLKVDRGEVKIWSFFVVFFFEKK